MTNDLYPPLPDASCEKVNSQIHSLGIILGILALPFLLYFAASAENRYAVAACVIYGLCFIMTFTMSVLFHSCRFYPRRALLKKLDRISIYFLIAGSYSPLIAYYLQNSLGATLLTILWTLAIAGIFYELFLVKKYFFISIPFYMVMGCLFVFTANRFFASMPLTVIILIITGVALYISGVFFYVREKKKHDHAVWHSFVLSGAMCHYVAIFLTASTFN